MLTFNFFGDVLLLKLSKIYYPYLTWRQILTKWTTTFLWRKERFYGIYIFPIEWEHIRPSLEDILLWCYVFYNIDLLPIFSFPKLIEPEPLEPAKESSCIDLLEESVWNFGDSFVSFILLSRILFRLSKTWSVVFPKYSLYKSLFSVNLRQYLALLHPYVSLQN